MANDNIQQFGDSWNTAVLGPARSYMNALTNHWEALAAIQIEAIKAYTAITLKEARGALAIRDADGFSRYMSSQSDFAREFSDRVKSDAERWSAANQTFLENANQVTRASVEEVEKAAATGVERVQKAARAS